MKKIKLSILLLMIGTLFSKGLGLIREILLAQKFGASYITDSFILSLAIPTVLITTLASAILTNYIPIYSEIEKESKEKAYKFNGILIAVIMLLATIIVVLFFIFTKPIVSVFAAGFNEIAFKYLIDLSRITIFNVYFILLSYILQGYLEYKEKFIGTSLFGILLNIGMICGIIFSTSENYKMLGYGVVIGYILSFVVLIILSFNNKFKVTFTFNIKDEYLKKLVILTLPIILNDAVWQINGLVDKSVASTLGPGYISAINYSHYIVDMVGTIFATSIATVFFPMLVKFINKKLIETVRIKIRLVLKNIIFVTMPFTFLIFIFSEPIVKVLLFRGAFDERNLEITSIAVSLYSLSLVFVCLKTVLFKIFYAFQDTKNPTISAVIAIILNIILTLILVKPFGYRGIIVATLVSSIISFIMLISLLNKKCSNIINKEFIINIAKIIFSLILMIITTLLIEKMLLNLNIFNYLFSLIFRVCLSSITGIIVYLISLKIIKYDFKK
ncbi:MAG: murein biosynthesis integral membrane protein MurJ [Clostridia bacterium]